MNPSASAVTGVPSAPSYSSRSQRFRRTRPPTPGTLRHPSYPSSVSSDRSADEQDARAVGLVVEEEGRDAQGQPDLRTGDADPLGGAQRPLHARGDRGEVEIRRHRPGARAQNRGVAAAAHDDGEIRALCI